MGKRQDLQLRIARAGVTGARMCVHPVGEPLVAALVCQGSLSVCVQVCMQDGHPRRPTEDMRERQAEHNYMTAFEKHVLPFLVIRAIRVEGR